jgi:hypothetical protein
VNWHTVRFVHGSTAVHVTVVRPHGKKLPEAGVHDTKTTPLLSDAAGGGQVTIAPQPPVGDWHPCVTMFEGQTKVGALVSISTTITNWHCRTTAPLANTVQLIELGPNPSGVPSGGLQFTVTDAGGEHRLEMMMG